jgi:hypothetical protein
LAGLLLPQTYLSRLFEKSSPSYPPLPLFSAADPSPGILPPLCLRQYRNPGVSTPCPDSDSLQLPSSLSCRPPTPLFSSLPRRFLKSVCIGSKQEGNCQRGGGSGRGGGGGDNIREEGLVLQSRPRKDGETPRIHPASSVAAPLPPRLAPLIDWIVNRIRLGRPRRESYGAGKGWPPQRLGYEHTHKNQRLGDHSGGHHLPSINPPASLPCSPFPPLLSLVPCLYLSRSLSISLSLLPSISPSLPPSLPLSLLHALCLLLPHVNTTPASTLNHVLPQGSKLTETSTMRWGTFPRRSAQTHRTLQTTFSSGMHSSWTTGGPRRPPSRSTYSTSSLTCATR